jgi:glycosyltransferase involved in cell wall biosynthesis/peptidoglycan/xylan/chitin deacetylase (PgdA/CDA1 family)
MITDIRSSVVIPVRDAEKTISQTLDSLLVQTDRGWEALIVDDGSIDGTPAIVAEYAARDSRFVALHSFGRGVSAARNIGISYAKGERILFLDGDDWIDRHFLANMNSVLNDNPAAVAAYCNDCRVMPDGSETPARRNPHIGEDPFEAFARTCATAIHSVLVKRSAVLEAGCFDIHLRTCEDWDLWQRIARGGGNWIHLDEKLSYYRVSDHSLTENIQQMLVDAHVVISRGFSQDTVVAHPARADRTGVSTTSGGAATAAYAYFALWCAGAECGRGRIGDVPTALLADIPRSETAADEIAWILLDSITVGARAVPAKLATGWPQFGRYVTDLITAIGQAWNDPAGARKVQYRFERMLLDYDDLSAPRPLTLTLGLRVDIRRLPALHPPNNIDRLYVYLCDGPQVLAVLDIGLLGEINREFWITLITEHLSHLHIENRRKELLRQEHKISNLIRRFRNFWLSNPDSHQHRLDALQNRMLCQTKPRSASRPVISGDSESYVTEKSPRDIGREAYWEEFFKKEDPWNYGSSYEQEKYQRQLELLSSEPAEHALELACAEGHFTRQLATKVKHLLASDISARALERARSRCSGHHNVDFVKLDLSADVLPGAMDLICCSEVLYLLNDEAELALVAGKMVQALRPGGHLITAHAFVLKDNMSRTGFDWENPYGAETIARVMEKVPDLALEVSIQTDLYRVDRYKRLLPGEVAPRPQVTVRQIEASIEREVTRFIVRNGAVRRRSEVAQSERRPHVPILMYHQIAAHGPEELARHRIDADGFAEQMLWLRRNGYHTINSEQLAWFLVNDYPFGGRPLLITFDDGYEDFADQAWPILKANDLSAEVFIVTDLVGRHAEWDASFGTPAALMDADKIVTLAAEGVSFGSHLASHPRSDRLSSSELAEELLRSRIQLEQWLERPATSLAAPFGCTDQRLRILAAECGYKTVFNTVNRAARLNDDPFDLPRIEVRGDCTLEAFVRCLEQYQ